MTPSNLKDAAGIRHSPKPYSQLTHVLSDTVAVGDAVTRSANNTVARGAEGDPFEGVAMSVERDAKGTVGSGGRLLVRCDAALAGGAVTGLVIGATPGNVKAAAAAAGNAWAVIVAETIQGAHWALVEMR